MAEKASGGNSRGRDLHNASPLVLVLVGDKRLVA